MIENQAQQTLNNLKKSDYPGRGIVCGLTPSGEELVQISHQFFSYKAAAPGYGHCIHTYSLSQTCMPFNSEPYWSKLFETVDENADFYWSILPENKRVALYAKHIDILSGKTNDKILSIYNQV